MEVKYIDHMGSDLTVVNAARVSFNKTSEFVPEYEPRWHGEKVPMALKEADKKLIAYLARGCSTGDWEAIINDVVINSVRHNDTSEPDFLEDLEEIVRSVAKMSKHWTPFGHPQITLHFKIPIFIANQLKRHNVGFVINEVSRRYVTTEPEFFRPNYWRDVAPNVKQGSSHTKNPLWNRGVGTGYLDVLEEAYENILETYNKMLEDGVCPEQARMILPQSMYTEFWMTGSLYGWSNVYNQRSDPHAQKEIQDLAGMIKNVVEPLFPVSWKELTK